MLVTQIVVQKNHEERANVYLDDKFYCGLSIEIIMKEQIKKGMDISKERIDQIILSDEKDTAFSKAMKYISSSLKTEKQIKEYLKRKLYNDITINCVIDKMKEYKYIDDEHFAKSFVLTYSKKYGKLKLVSALKSKGVSDLIIESVLEGCEQSSNIETVAEKYMKNKQINSQTLIKLNRFLYSRGYEFDDIKTVVDKYKED